MYQVVGSSFINLVAQVILWLTSNFIGAAYMLMIVFILFAVIFTLGGKNQ